ncbi:MULTISPECIES: PTS system mannose/fructose/sorbose family transporter subunit IID [unclassified Lactobacillus]|uniref:PTS system mannose/fructose/sorbose family transporter subunit IID n=1 Tax=unclassified Lactobacillus TaxID=2620435 RepID=UPI000EFA571E|nr:PTS system mannose/fructose/sorbose family transporter subunit IID [Lactobacillus sp. ESL0237]RMC44417.1 PTS system mannose/fructose/sorbose family transporter subunit IID [Lactobacillus sp. ESL0234]RMC45723.1 PTS system mannose/fructose/sorbose family transporter subunit IID [Lactobacillus sp. ESL0236]RMC46040.1 PTS system mannose/fructose/sorbose family transporter subunit IID [Lactobacillus sp. ESL0230]
MKMKNSKLLTKKDLMKTFWRSFTMEWAWNYERQMNLGYSYAMVPALRKIYGNNKEKLQAAYKRHLEFYNVTPWLSTFPLGISIAMEEQNKLDPEFDDVAINNIKVALMGPLSGIGDSFFWGTLRVIATGIGTSLALQGNILGPLLFLLIFNIPALLVRYYGLFVGYNVGSSFIDKIQKTGLMDKLTYGASVLGLAVVGAMVATMVTLKMPLKIGSGAQATSIQKICDGIVPGILPLLFTFFIFWLDRKGWKSQYILLLIAAIGIFGAWSGLLG